jgi:hypothetical protein
LVVKIISESLLQHDEKHVVPTPLSRIRVGRKIQVRKILKACLNEILKTFPLPSHNREKKRKNTFIGDNNKIHYTNENKIENTLK